MEDLADSPEVVFSAPLKTMKLAPVTVQQKKKKSKRVKVEHRLAMQQLWHQKGSQRNLYVIYLL